MFTLIKHTLSLRFLFSSWSNITSPFMLWNSSFFLRRHFFADFLFCCNLYWKVWLVHVFVFSIYNIYYLLSLRSLESWPKSSLFSLEFSISALSLSALFSFYTLLPRIPEKVSVSSLCCWDSIVYSDKIFWLGFLWVRINNILIITF